MIFVAHHNSPEVLQPRKQAFDFPATFVTTQFSAVLRLRLFPIGFMRRNHLNVEFRQLCIERVRIIRLVANHLLRSLIGEPLANSFADKFDGRSGEAELVWTARGRPKRSATAMSFVPLPRLVAPTPKPLFSPR